MSDALMEMRGITKRFPGVLALDNESSQLQSQAGVADGKLPHAGLFAFGTPQLLTLASR